MKLNVELLLKVKTHILEEPKRLAMNIWIAKDLEPGQLFNVSPHHRVPACGTVGCIAGWAAQLAEPGVKFLATRANDLLGIRYLPYGNLFYTTRWPEKFKEPYNEALDKGDLETAAIVTGNVIDWFVAEYKDLDFNSHYEFNDWMSKNA